MRIIKTTLAIAAAGCLSLITVHPAGRDDGSEASSRHLSSTHRASAGGSRIEKASSNRGARSHTRDLSNSTRTHRNRTRQRTEKSRDATRIANDMQPTDVNVPVELPRLESENESENEAEND